MPVNSLLGAIEKPSDTDPFADAAQAMRTIVDTIDQVVVIKTGAETVNNSGTLQSDDEMLFDVYNGKTYAWEMHLIYGCPVSTVDVKLAISAPTGVSTWFGIGLDSAAGSSFIGNLKSVALLDADNTDTASFGVSATSGVIRTGVHLHGTFVAAADGEVRLRWAQDTPTTDDLTLRPGSYLRAQVIPS